MTRLAFLLWCVLLGAALAVPLWSRSSDWEEELTRYTVRPALVYYAAALTLMLFLTAGDWLGGSVRGRLARGCWTLAWAAYVIHVAIAFGVYHHGSHGAAVQHVQARSGFGAGLYFSHLFTLLWTIDVAWWWFRPRAYAARRVWIDFVLHAYMLFIVLNATVVFEAGLIRWAGVTLFAGLAMVAGWRLVVRSRVSARAVQ
jgi:hypothetical protein